MAGNKDGKIIRETISVFCRLRPPIPEDEYVWDNEEDGDDNNVGGVKQQTMPLVRKDGFWSVIQAPPGSSRVQKDGKSSKNNRDHSGTFTYRRSPQDAMCKEFSFHGFLGPQSTQQQVYDAAAHDIVRGVLAGYNGTIFAYGQTGSGKTHTMRGASVSDKGPDSECLGLTPRALQDLFTGIREEKEKGCSETVSVSLSYLQIYCEVLQDLFDPSNTRLSVRERDGRVFVEGLSRVPVQSMKQCMRLLEEGDANRVTASTKLNATSSRSHAALLVHVTRREESNNHSDGSTVIESTLYLVDLAGSERAKRSGSTMQRFEELKAINLSLSALGNCIAALSQGRPHIPFRDSKLTRLLQQSLGGNSRTSLVVNVPPGYDVMGESHCSLLFAQRAMKVAVVAKVNRQIDYAMLYSSAQARLDEHDDTLTKLQIEKSRTQHDNSELQQQVEELEGAKAELEKRLQASEVGFREALKALEKASSDPGGERAVAAVETVSQKWRSEVENLEAMHAKELREMRSKCERRLAAYMRSLDQSNEAWQSVELELTKEREGHLATLTDYRKCHDRLLSSESESSARIAELLAEVNEKTNTIEEMQAQLEAAQGSVTRSEGALHTLQTRVQGLELRQPGGSNQGGSANSEPVVAKSQVVTMERLFAETVGRLENRVQQLESIGTSKPPEHRTVRSLGRVSGLAGSSGNSVGSNSARSNGSTSHHAPQSARPPLHAHSNSLPGGERPSLWATRRAPAAASSGLRRVIGPGRPRAGSFGSAKGGPPLPPAPAPVKYSTSSYRAYHL